MFATIVPTHYFATLILKAIDWLLNTLGFGKTPRLEELLYLIIVVAIALGIGWLLRRVTVGITRKIISLRDTPTGQEIIREHTVTKCSHIIPPLILMAMTPLAFETDPLTLKWIMRLVGSYALICFGLGLNAVVSLLWTIFDRRHNTENHPLRGVLNVLHGVVWIVISIIVISILIDKSPMALLGGLGAFAAALMLIFKDSILGFVAGIQLSNNDMLRVGDWIVVPSTPANGTVIEVTLTVVKVQNWDNTIIMLPPYTLVSSSFQNWRGMKDSGARRIMRSVIIDNTTIAPATPDFISKIEAKYPALTSYIESRRKVKDEGKWNIYDGNNGVVNGSIDTNLGLFRAYLCQWLISNPSIDKTQNMMVRTLEATSVGTPLQIYCFSNNISWIAYEAITSEMFEFIALAANEFDLTIFNESDGNSMEIDLMDKTSQFHDISKPSVGTTTSSQTQA